jgi:hypothetical protein
VPWSFFRPGGSGRTGASLAGKGGLGLQQSPGGGRLEQPLPSKSSSGGEGRLRPVARLVSEPFRPAPVIDSSRLRDPKAGIHEEVPSFVGPYTACLPGFDVLGARDDGREFLPTPRLLGTEWTLEFV